MVLITLVVLVFYAYTRQTTDALITSQVDAIGQTIVSNAEMVYFYGDKAKTTLDFNFPEHIQRISLINNNELEFDLALNRGNVTQIYFSRVNLSGSFSSADVLPGNKQFVISQEGESVSIQRIT